MLGRAMTTRNPPVQISLRGARVALLLWIIALVIVPALTVAVMDPAALGHLHMEPAIHRILEIFCGLTALLISAILLSGRLINRNAGSRVFGAAFLLMGTLDVLHAFADPSGPANLFVTLHTLSALGGSLVIGGGMLLLAARRGEPWVREDVVFGTSALVLLLVVGYAGEIYMSRWIVAKHEGDTAFSAVTHQLHHIAAMLYAVGAVLVYLRYHLTHQRLSLFVAAILLLYAQSAFLFAYSGMWSFTWWLWHAAKVALYFGVLVAVFVALRVALEALARSGEQLTGMNTDLRKAESHVMRINKELENRNAMVRDAMASFHLDHAMTVIRRAMQQLLPVQECELALDMPADEVAEFDRMIRRLGSPWSVKGQAAGSANAAPLPPRSICIPLDTAGNRIGELRLIDVAAGETELASVLSLAAEIGPIVNNSVMYHRWLDADAFRVALLDVSTMLTSTLNLDRVLHAVCTESARLLDSDAALVWLTAEDGAGFTSVSSASGETGSRNSAQLALWLQERMVRDEMLRGADGRHRPHAFLVDSPGSAPGAAGVDGMHGWGALALFPLTEDNYLVGVMVLLREERIAYSATSLAKGELLGQQVRIAVNNARTYRRLNEINHQLQVSEESRARAEQMTFLGHMAASIAHEVRNPLSAMQNCVSVLAANCGADDKSQAALEIIRDELHRLNKLTRDFLLFGKPGMAPAQPVMLSKVLESTCANLERHVAQEGLPIVVRRSTRGCGEPAIVDPGSVETVLWNLLLNAAQAIEGPGTISASVHQSATHIMLSVTDTGSGIPPEERRKIFDPFYSRKSHGAGLGLAIVSRFVKSWRGTIRIVSQPGRGTGFFIRAPLAPPARP